MNPPHPVGQRAGPGCRMSHDLISCSAPVAHRRHRLPAGPRGDALGPNFLPHHEPTITSGARRAGSAVGDRSRSRPIAERASSGNTSSPPAMLDQLAHPADRADHRLVPLLEVDARPVRARRRRAPRPRRAAPRSRRPALRARGSAPTSRPITRIVSRISCTLRWLKISTCRFGGDELLREVGLDVGEADHQVGLERLDLGRRCRR